MGRSLLVAGLLAAIAASPVAARDLRPGSVVDGMTVVAVFPHDRPTAVVSSRDGRTFVSLPFGPFSDERHGATVVEVSSDGTVRPYPNAAWNQKGSDLAPGAHFLNVQSLTLDAEGFLWALDTGNPKRAGIVPGGAKLVKIDRRRQRRAGVPIGSPALTKADSYLNDVRVDAARQVAYVTDSVHGGIVVVDLKTGSARMTLAEPHPPAILAEQRRAPVVEGNPPGWGGRRADVPCDRRSCAPARWGNALRDLPTLRWQPPALPGCHA
jgi:hypothetical protein